MRTPKPQDLQDADVVDVDPVTGEVTGSDPDLASLERFYLGAPVAVDDSSEAVYQRISEQLMSAKTVDEVLADIEAIGARDILDTPLVLLATTWHQSSYEQGAPWFAAIEVSNPETLERVVITTGGRTPLKQIVRIMQIDRDNAGLHKPSEPWTLNHISGRLAYPEPILFRQSRRPTKNGYWPLRIVRPPRPVEPV